MYTIIAGECNSEHPESFEMSRPYGADGHVLLMAKTNGVFTFTDQKLSVKPNQVVLIKREVPYHCVNPDGEYSDDWIRFRCDDDHILDRYAKLFYNAIPLSNPPRFTLYIQQILWENSYADEKWRDENVDMLFKLLMNNVEAAYQDKNCPKKYSPYYARMQELRFQIQSQPMKKYSIKELAESVGISCSYFQHLYSDFFGISLQSDLINMRIERVKTILHNTDLSVEKIADICGYSSEVHLYRQFRQKTGMTPKDYRMAYRK
ncbi:helix-turn-helix transcriptional regulator [Blautia liquoris]|uniref:Helix-turn-helix transcriptional regulator n=1 Tax=Blautia liquoris TaxID=2779518 RepID=A0A7M2RK70_9FIRM|nr:AraC family transcriptional regulator [Blautia liquoris]QOV19730.1 helix-turn-helix transcriptional regulator [Blautia liquoris]